MGTVSGQKRDALATTVQPRDTPSREQAISNSFLTELEWLYASKISRKSLQALSTSRLSFPFTTPVGFYRRRVRMNALLRRGSMQHARCGGSPAARISQLFVVLRRDAAGGDGHRPPL